ncbi:MAG: hypothetical protein SGJ27_10580 [Candidatus Melainabacteria bacterium]|nr:hypothetical protein [Candidatus Melainabacteria bacterium]
MVKKKNSIGEAKTFDAAVLKPIAARRVLLELLERQPELKDIIFALANENANNPCMEDLVTEIVDALERISVGDIEMNSGRTWRGYREEGEGAAEVLSEPLQPYLDRYEKLLRKKEDHVALVMGEAIILALYRVSHGDNFSDLKEYVEEFFEETADWVARLWRSAGNVDRASVRRFDPDRTIPASFVQQHVPEWDWLLSED